MNKSCKTCLFEKGSGPNHCLGCNSPFYSLYIPKLIDKERGIEDSKDADSTS